MEQFLTDQTPGIIIGMVLAWFFATVWGVTVMIQTKVAVGAKMLHEALSQQNITFETKAAIILDWVARDATDRQADALGNHIGRISSERLRA